MAASKMPRHILFLCVANSARSQMAEGLARRIFPEGVRISSAGSEPSKLNPLAVEALREIGIDISSQYSKSVKEFESSSVDLVITLCAEEVCPLFAKPVEKLNWGLPDPAGAKGSNEEQLQKFREVRDELKKLLGELVDGRFPKLSQIS